MNCSGRILVGPPLPLGAIFLEEPPLRRTLAILACAAAATVVHAPPARTPPPPGRRPQGPVQNGPTACKFSDTFKTDGAIFTRRTGTLQFGRAGVAASDISTKFNLKAADLAEMPRASSPCAKPEQVITIGSTAYIKGGVPAALSCPRTRPGSASPAVPPRASAASSASFLNPTELTTLQKLIKKSKRVGSVYVGKITFGEVYSTSKWLKGSQRAGRPQGGPEEVGDLVQAVRERQGPGDPGRQHRQLDGARAWRAGPSPPTPGIVSWGTKVSIKAPTEGVADLDEIEFDGLGDLEMSAVAQPGWRPRRPDVRSSGRITPERSGSNRRALAVVSARQVVSPAVRRRRSRRPARPRPGSG